MTTTATAPATQTITPGFYWNALGVFRVVESDKNPGHYFAKQLNPQTHRWSYAKGAIYRLQPQTRVTLEQAKQYGVKMGSCLICGRELTDPSSVAQGIGPVCAKGF